MAVYVQLYIGGCICICIDRYIYVVAKALVLSPQEITMRLAFYDLLESPDRNLDSIKCGYICRQDR